HLDRRRRRGPCSRGGWLHIDHSAAHGPHQLCAHRDGAQLEPRMTGSGPGDGFGGYRARLVETLREKGIRGLSVLHAVAQVPRHLFVPTSVRHNAYEDSALPIGSGQTISQPYIQARYLEAVGLTGQEKVLEIGTGS